MDVVVSAMAGFRDQLAEWVTEATPHSSCTVHQQPEHDVVLASGEQVAAGLLALALHNLGMRARSWLGWQLPIKTTSVTEMHKFWILIRSTSSGLQPKERWLLLAASRG